jgi:hypothetical protein
VGGDEKTVAYQMIHPLYVVQEQNSKVLQVCVLQGSPTSNLQ